jgi:hypothetical protein
LNDYTKGTSELWLGPLALFRAKFLPFIFGSWSLISSMITQPTTENSKNWGAYHEALAVLGKNPQYK